jgi:protoheme IX farnesyltransferase
LSTDAIAASQVQRQAGRVADFAELVKARLTLLVLVTTAAGFYLAPPRANYLAMFHAVFGAALAAAGAAALNEWWERRLDAAMERTRSRPLPAGRMSATAGLVIGVVLSCAGVVYLNWTTNALAASLTAATIVIYIFAYTPLKRVSTANTLVGAIPGAIPPMIGWAAARGQLDAGAWCLFAIVFLWQMPHFFAIAWMCREDYARAGFQMVATGDESGARSASQAVLFAMLLLLIAGGPTFVGMASPIYLAIEIALSGLFVAAAMRFHRTQMAADARKLFLASIIYLPLLLLTLVFTKR